MTRKPQFPTPVQDIALNLIFAVMGESRINRTQREYEAIAENLPPLKVLTYKVNELLKRAHEHGARSGVRLPQLCRFKAGDERYTYEEYPETLSSETIRAALVVAGMRRRRRRSKSL